MHSATIKNIKLYFTYSFIWIWSSICYCKGRI